MGAIGSGKTTLIAKLSEEPRTEIGRCLNGDDNTSNDADAHRETKWCPLSRSPRPTAAISMRTSSASREDRYRQSEVSFIENIGKSDLPG